MYCVYVFVIGSRRGIGREEGGERERKGEGTRERKREAKLYV